MAKFDTALLFPQSANPAFGVDVRRASFEKMLPAIEAMDDEPLAPIVIDVATALGVVSAAVYNVAKLRAELGALPEMPLTEVDELPDCVGALAYANTLHQIATRPQEPLLALSDRGSALRARLYGDVKRLVDRGLIPSTELGKYVGTIGYKIVGADLMLLGDLLERKWSSMAGKTAITREEIEEAKRLGFELVTSVGMREYAQSSLAETTRLRLATYNLLLHRYDRLRRAVSYVRWNEGDLERFAPSLYVKKRGASIDVPKPDENDASTDAPNTPATTSSTSATPAVADDAFEV